MKTIKNLKIENAILNIFLATIFFSIMNVIVKYLDHIPFFELVFFRALISVAIGWVVLKTRKISIKPKNPKTMLARCLTGTVSLILYFYSLQHMPLATAATIQLLAPIFTVFVAIFVLKEKASLIQWFFIFICFCGVLMVKGFDDRVEWFVLIMGIISAFCSGISYNLIRKMKDSDPSERVIFYFPLVTLFIVAPFTFFNFTPANFEDTILIVILGFITYLAQYFMTNAYQNRPPGYVSIFNYLGVFYAALLGYFIFDETLSLQASLGILIIVMSVVLSTLLSTKEEVKKTNEQNQ